MKNHLQTFRDNPLTFNMIAIEGGTFDMGSEGENAENNEKPVHAVTLSDYWLSEVPVTQAVWESVMGLNPSYFVDANRPVETVSWLDIAEEKNPNSFLSKLNKNTEAVRPAGTEYRLPTEAQWEYAAKGGKYWKKYNFEYVGSDKLNEVGWYYENSHNETKLVGLKTPNLLGLYDMSGNIYEWCEDQRHDDYNGAPADGSAWIDKEEGTDRVLRGGSSFNIAQYCRALRNSRTPTLSTYGLGFRLALVFPSV